MFLLLRLEVLQGPLDANAAAKLAVLETLGSTKNTWWRFLGKGSFAVAVDVAVAARHNAANVD